MPDEFVSDVPGYQLDLAMWSLVVFLVYLITIAIVTVNWYRNKPRVPTVLLSAAILLGLLVSPVLAIVSAVLLAGLVISTVLRQSSST